MTDPFTPSPELEAVVRRWLDAYAARRAGSAANFLSASDAASFVGSDAGEVFGGQELRRIFSAFTEGQAKLFPENLEVEAWQRGPMGWALMRFTLAEPISGKRIAVRSTVVFSLEQEIWRIVHVHNSNPTPNIDAHGYESRGLRELAEAAREERVEIAQTGIASIMFTDVVESTALAAALGDAPWSRIVTAHLEAVAAHVAAAGGALVKTLGDGTLSSFGSAGGAMTAARAIMAANAARTEEPRLRLRISVHTGDLVRTEDDFLGGVVNKAARIAAAAAADEIRVSDETRIMVGGAAGLGFEDAASVALKGLEGEHLIHRLRWREGEGAA